MGHELLLPSYDQNAIHKECSEDISGSARSNNSDLFVDEVKRHLSDKGIDLVFTYFDDRHVLPEAVLEVRSLGVVTINFYCNATHQFDSVAKVASAFDYCMVPERESLKKYRSVGAYPVHVQMAANPKYYYPVDVREEYDVVFTGSTYLNREEYLAYLCRHKVDVNAYGAGWKPEREKGNYLYRRFWSLPRKMAGEVKRKVSRSIGVLMGKRLPEKCCHSPVSDEEMIQLFSRGRISLGLADVLSREGRMIRHIRLRDFEAPMSGACYLTGYQDELSEYYEIGKEIVCYETKEDMLEKALFYLQHEKARQSIRKMGRLRALAEHTWQHRFEDLFKKIGF